MLYILERRPTYSRRLAGKALSPRERAQVPPWTCRHVKEGGAVQVRLGHGVEPCSLKALRHVRGVGYRPFSTCVGGEAAPSPLNVDVKFLLLRLPAVASRLDSWAGGPPVRIRGRRAQANGEYALRPGVLRNGAAAGPRPGRSCPRQRQGLTAPPEPGVLPPHAAPEEHAPALVTHAAYRDVRASVMGELLPALRSTTPSWSPSAGSCTWTLTPWQGGWLHETCLEPELGVRRQGGKLLCSSWTTTFPSALVPSSRMLQAAVGGRAVVGHLQLAPARPVRDRPRSRRWWSQ